MSFTADPTQSLVNPSQDYSTQGDGSAFGTSQSPLIDFQETNFFPTDLSGRVGSAPSTVPSTSVQNSGTFDDVDFSRRSTQDNTGLLDQELGNPEPVAAPKEEGGKPSLFSIKRYQKYFDVTTYEVGLRIKDSVMISEKRDFIESATQRPDFWGPFWICTTLVFLTAAGGNFADYLSNDKDEWYYDIGEVSFSAAMFYGYISLVPFLLFVALRALTTTEVPPLKLQPLLCLYGYSLSIFIPVSVLCVIPNEVVRWLMVLATSMSSAAFLVLNLKKPIEDCAPERCYHILGGVALVHMCLGLVMKLYFFQYWD